MKKILSYKMVIVVCLIIIFSFNKGALAETEEVTSTKNEAEVQTISLTDAINLTWKNNIELKLLEKEINARELDKDRAYYYRDKLIDADEKIKDGWDAYYQQRSQFESLKPYLSEEEIKKIEDQLSKAEAELRANAQYEINNLANAQVVELYTTKAALGLDVTKLGVEEARKKYALLTRQYYYEVLKNQRLVSVKEAAVKRAESQYKLAADSFQAGFRAKDDMLMAQAQLSLLKADLVNAKNALHLAETALKEVMGLSQTTEIRLIDDFAFDRNITPLEQGIDQALKNRVEIKKSEMELKICEINMELAKRYTASNTFDYRQCQLNLENAKLSLDLQKQTVQSEIYQSYLTVQATAEMLDYVQESVKQAKDAVDIATYRYQEGYGIPSSVLKSLNMEDAGGTIFEVLAAEEKLAEVEEKVVEIIYGYNLAKSKYDVDICADSKL